MNPPMSDPAAYFQRGVVRLFAYAVAAVVVLLLIEIMKLFRG